MLSRRLALGLFVPVLLILAGYVLYPSLRTFAVGLTPEQKKFLEDHGSSAFTEAFYTELTRRSYEVLKPLI